VNPGFIILIGFMGTGKTAVGQLLAKKLAMEFFELDSLSEKKAGKSIRWTQRKLWLSIL